MKKLIFTLTLFPLLWAACSTDTHTEEAGTGSISLVPSVNSDITVKTRADIDLTEYTITLEGPDNVEQTCPADGIVTGLTPGTYKVTLSNLPEDYTPEFDDPRYSGINQSVAVSAGAPTQVPITLTQANSGIMFEYDESLTDAGFTDLTPTVTMGSNHLDFSMDDPTLKGYFAPGVATFTLKNGDEPMKLGDDDSKQLTLARQQLWRIILTAVEIETGSIVINATVEELSNPTNNESWLITEGEESSSGFTIAGYGNATVTVTYVDGTTETLTCDANGQFSPTGGEKVIKSVQKTGGPVFLIGRKANEKIALNTDGTNLMFRVSETHNTLIGTYAELDLIRNPADKGGEGDIFQDADIDMMNIEFASLRGGGQFAGNFDGQGYKIHNLAIHEFTMEEVGLFSGIAGNFFNINIMSGEIVGKAKVGAVCGYNDGGIIYNCTNHAMVLGINDVGGIVGFCPKGQIEECTNYGDITATDKQGGGVCGNLERNGELTKCYNYGYICGYEFGSSIGGVVGRSLGTMSHSINYGDVKGLGVTGGVIGFNEGLFNDCENNGDVSNYLATGYGGLGGVIGQNQIMTNLPNLKNTGSVTMGGDNPGGAGGIIGINQFGVVTNSINLGTVIGQNVVGGITGHNFGMESQIKKCVNKGSVTGIKEVGGLSGYTSGIYHYIEESYNEGSVNGETRVGGLLGFHQGATMTGCVNKGDVTATGAYCGGLVGYNESAIYGCYNIAAVSGQDHTGGLTGYNHTYTKTGGCYNVGNVTGTTNSGAVFGEAKSRDGIVFSDCYWAGPSTLPGIGSLTGANTAAIVVIRFADGTPAGGATTGWPTDVAAKHWGLYTNSAADGYWWKTLGTQGTTNYPTLWWE